MKWIRNLTAESLATGVTVALLAYSLLVFLAYVTSLVVLSYLEIYRGDFSLFFNVVMCALFYGTLGIHLSPRFAWFGNKRTDRRHNRLMCRAVALVGALFTAFLGSAYFYFELMKNYWPLVFAEKS